MFNLVLKIHQSRRTEVEYIQNDHIDIIWIKIKKKKQKWPKYYIDYSKYLLIYIYIKLFKVVDFITIFWCPKA